MDNMDRLLSQLPGEPAPQNLARRIQWEIRKRRRRDAFLLLGLAGALGLVGVWLSLPVVMGALPGIALPESGLPLLLHWSELALQDLSRLVGEGWVGLAAFQSGWTRSGVTAVPGLFALGLSALLLLRFVLPHEEIK